MKIKKPLWKLGEAMKNAWEKYRKKVMEIEY